MSTPEASCSSLIKNKYSPFCNGINKSLLTPCRQVGLSRKRKTFNNSAVKTSENLDTSNNNSINSSPTNETTPVTYRTVSERKKKKREHSFLSSKTLSNQGSFIDGDLKDNLKENENLQSSNNKLCKKDLLQSFTSEDLFDTKDEDQHCSLKITGIIEDNENISNIEVVKEKNNVEQKKIHHNSSKSKKKTLSSDFINFENVCIKSEKSFSQTSLSDDSDDDFVICGTDKNKKRSTQVESKCIKKTFSLRKSSDCATNNSFQNDNLEETNLTKKCKIQLQKLSEDEIKSDIIGNSRKHVTLIKKINSHSTDDADFFTSTPEEENIKRKNLEKKMIMLETQIKQKHLLLENLERASIYKSKHNIPELKQLTSIWQDGCVQALKDLLTHLQAHGPIDLITLLNNMRIPKDIIAKLPL